MLIRHKALVWAAVVLIAVVAALLFWFPEPVQRASGPLRHEAYIWQRAWTPEMKDRILDAVPPLRGLVVLVAEVSWSAGQPRVAEAALDYAALRACNGPVGLAVRINAYSGPFDQAAEATRLVADVAATAIRNARASGLSVDELQLDFDCPQSKLGGYRVWMEAVRRRIGDLPLAITVLPSWLDSPQFAPLVRTAGAFVLQVHALQGPQSLQDIPPLCDPQRSRRWVERAAEVGVPFRVALPTYSYLLAFDATGAYLGASAETPSRTWPAGTQFRLLSADAKVAAALVQQWTEDRPLLLTGILWYRLPIEADRFNWQWKTLHAIINGRSPRADLGVETRQVEQGLIEVDMHNAGDADAHVDVSVSLRWDGARPVACDALGEFDGDDLIGNQWTLRPRADALPTVLRPGERKMIAWMRFDTNREVRAYVTPNSD